MSTSPQVSWNGVAGYDSLKARLDDVLGHLSQRAELAARGLPMSAGLLLEGLPGCGKTSLAHAIAGSQGLVAVPGQIREATPIGSVANLRRMFQQVHDAGPAVLVLDDLDLLVGDTIVDEQARSVGAELRILLEDAPVHGVYVVGCVRLATTLPLGLRRAGRFDHHVSVMPPSPADRRALVDHHVHAIPGLALADDVDLEQIATATPLTTGADLAAIVRDAARRALTPNSDRIVIGQRHLLAAITHHRQSLPVLEVERWLDAVRAFPGNEDAAAVLDADIEAFKTGRGALAAWDASALLPSRAHDLSDADDV